MDALPEFNQHGDLPPGIYRVSLKILLERFSEGGSQRQLVARRLERIYRLALESGHVARFVVFGSFVTAKPVPNDVDVFMLMDDAFDIAGLTGEARLLFEHATAQNYEGASIFWIRRLALFESEEASVAYWQTKRDGTRRGIVEVIAND